MLTAVKCNPNSTVIKVLAALNAGFDCASQVSLPQRELPWDNMIFR